MLRPCCRVPSSQIRRAPSVQARRVVPLRSARTVSASPSPSPFGSSPAGSGQEIDYRDYKRTTGLVGIPVLPPKEARSILIKACERVLKEVKQGIPETAAYRTSVELAYGTWLKAAQQNEDPRDIERAIDLGQIEQLVLQAEEELSLIPVLRESKPWEIPPGHKIPITVQTDAPRIKDKSGQLLKPPAPKKP